MPETKVGSAYVEVTPKASKNFGSVDGEFKKHGDQSGRGYGDRFAEGAKGRISAATVAIGNLLADAAKLGAQAIKGALSDAIGGFADYQQLTGGVETLMGTQGAESVQQYADIVGKSVDAVKGEYETLSQVQSQTLDNAANAFATAGMSTNQYMETVTGFAASLKAGLGEARLGELASESDKAVRDMADNANKMGTSVDAIQTAYAGFAKQNYTMLDNLKLGYGGTKTEMERLLKDAQKISGQKYDVSNFADIVDAIHVVQTEMGITGTTMKEAKETVSGSVAAMKGAWSNWVSALGREDAKMGKMTNQLVKWVGIAAKNVLPVVTRAFDALSSSLPGLVGKLLPKVLPALGNLVSSIGKTLLTLTTRTVPEALSKVGSLASEAILGSLGQVGQKAQNLALAGGELVNNIMAGISSALPVLSLLLKTVGSAIIEVLPSIATSLVSGFSGLLSTFGTTMGPTLIALVSRLASAAASALPGMLSQLAGLAAQALPYLLLAVGDVGSIVLNVVTSLSTGLVGALPSLLSSVGSIVTTLVDALLAAAPALLTAAAQAFMGLAQALPVVLPQLITEITGVITDILEVLSFALPQLISTVASLVVTAAPTILSSAVTMFMSLVQAIPQILPPVLAGIWSLVSSVGSALISALPTILSTAVSMFTGIVHALPTIIPVVLSTLGSAIVTLVTFLIQAVPAMLAGAKQLFMSIAQGLVDAVPQIAEALWSFIQSLPQIILDGIGGIASAAGDLFGSFVGAITGTAPEADAAASSVVAGAAQAATDNADASAAGKAITDSITAALDFSSVESDTQQAMQQVTATAAEAADGAEVAINLTDAAATNLDQAAMDVPATQMATNAVDAAKGVDAAEIGRAFSEAAASGVDTSAMAEKAQQMAAAASGNLDSTSTVTVRADLTGVNQLKAASGQVTNAYKTMSNAVATSMKRASSSAASAAASVRSSINGIRGKTVTVDVRRGHVELPHFSMSGSFDAKTKSVPSVHVSWYGKGGIIDDATLFGAGERGAELVWPSYDPYLDKYASAIASHMDGGKETPEQVFNITVNGVAGPEQAASETTRKVRLALMAIE